MPVEIDPWFASAAVQAMKDFQRWWFMSLLLRGWQLDPPCHLPNDQNKLWMLAGAASFDAWKKHSAIVLAEFDSVGDGQWLLNKHQYDLYLKKLAVNKSYSSRGKEGAGKRELNRSSAQAQLSNSSSNVSDSYFESPPCVAFELESFDFEKFFEELQAIYPRRNGSYIAASSAQEAIERIAGKRKLRRSEAAGYLLKRAKLYVQLVEPKFVANLDKFLTQEIYDHDESVWSSERASGPDMAIGTRREGPWTQEEYDALREGKQ